MKQKYILQIKRYVNVLKLPTENITGLLEPEKKQWYNSCWRCFRSSPESAHTMAYTIEQMKMEEPRSLASWRPIILFHCHICRTKWKDKFYSTDYIAKCKQKKKKAKEKKKKDFPLKRFKKYISSPGNQSFLLWDWFWRWIFS